mmetsp:Transcript_17305/g.15274  ORF Transcript_17305/g.15274 Transcript_17305/m.15274 type:complete len:159 (+) Transcript_17305:482-958(+)
MKKNGNIEKTGRVNKSRNNKSIAKINTGMPASAHSRKKSEFQNSGNNTKRTLSRQGSLSSIKNQVSNFSIKSKRPPIPSSKNSKIPLSKPKEEIKTDKLKSNNEHIQKTNLTKGLKTSNTNRPMTANTASSNIPDLISNISSISKANQDKENQRNFKF